MTFITDPRALLASLFDAAVKAADPLTGIKGNLPAKPKGRTVVVSAGKGTAQMARALLAADTDGIDGSESNAGAFVDGDTIRRVRAAGLDPHRLLNGNDSCSALNAIGDLFHTGPTGTNVNDMRIMLVK
ncbi:MULTISPECIES: MOFRL family protein [unclassified Rhizobium]|uniref:MOFRL family protein n=1 Tax=unclassified Rhizobium TaxID=2613769 RepID=UPI001ADA78AB|nr:DUF4147 domain-containing protein [Rhizobium sp. 16-488-2b]MBO9174348.1 DUF4147 domain-containing protein [Rhizobium sp. 16-488-2a]